MQKDSLPTRILKIILAVLVTVLAVSALAAVTALLLYGLVLAAVALVLLFILSPEDLRAFVKAAGWLKTAALAVLAADAAAAAVAAPRWRKRHRKEADSAGSRLFFVSRSAVRLQLESL